MLAISLLDIALPEGSIESMPVGAVYATPARARVKKVTSCMMVGAVLRLLRLYHFTGLRGEEGEL